MKLRTFLPLFMLLIAFSNHAQEKIKIPQVVKWEFTAAPSKDNKDEVILSFTATIEKDWHMYSQSVPADGPVATAFTFKPDDKRYTLTGKTEEPAAEKKQDEAFGVELASFSGTVTFTQKIRRNSKEAFKVSGEVEYMTCNNMQCLPPRSVAFDIDVPAL